MAEFFLGKTVTHGINDESLTSAELQLLALSVGWVGECQNRGSVDGQEVVVVSKLASHFHPLAAKITQLEEQVKSLQDQLK